MADDGQVSGSGRNIARPLGGRTGSALFLSGRDSFVRGQSPNHDRSANFPADHLPGLEATAATHASARTPRTRSLDRLAKRPRSRLQETSRRS